jgi:hypothetical protein
MSEPSLQSPQIRLQASGEMPVLLWNRWRRAMLAIVRSGSAKIAVSSKTRSFGTSSLLRYGRIRSMIVAAHRAWYAPFQGTGISARPDRESLEVMSNCYVVGRLLGLSKLRKIKQQLNVLNFRFDFAPLYSMCNLRDGLIDGGTFTRKSKMTGDKPIDIVDFAAATFGPILKHGRSGFREHESGHQRI